MFRAGDRIDSYVLKERIGKGAFGVVWLAEETTHLTSHKVALKLPNEETVDLEAIRQEASLWEQVKGHPNVLPIIKADIVEGQIYIASEYAPDGSLADWLKRNDGRAPSNALAGEITKGILSGLGHLHSKQVIHRDLKPDNILLQDETPRIADFGIARALKESHSSQIAGTPSFMAPEGFKGIRSEQTDIWAAGVIFYQLLTGQLPFPQTDLMSLMNAIIYEEPRIETQKVPGRFLHIINKALEKDLSKRYSKVAAMRDDLRKIPFDDFVETISMPGIEDDRLRANNFDTAPFVFFQNKSKTFATGAVADNTLITADDKQDTFSSEPAAATASFFANKNKILKWSGAVLAGTVFILGAAYTTINSDRNTVSSEKLSNTNEISRVGAPLKADAPKNSLENQLKWAEWAKMLEDDDYDRIIRETTEEIERDPANAVAYRMRATAYFNLEKADSVRMDIRQVLRLTENPQTAEEYEAKCYALKILNKSDEALKNCAKALELDSDLALAYNVRGTIYHHRGMYDLAIAEYSKAIERIRRASFFENRAISYEEMKKKNLAEADYKMADTLRNSKLSAPTSNAQAGGPLTKKPEAPQVSKPKLQPMAEKPPQPKPAARKPKITIDDIMKP